MRPKKLIESLKEQGIEYQKPKLENYLPYAVQDLI